MKFLTPLILLAAIASAVPAPAPNPESIELSARGCTTALDESVQEISEKYKRCTYNWIKRSLPEGKNS